MTRFALQLTVILAFTGTASTFCNSLILLGSLLALISVWLDFLTTFQFILSRCWLGDLFAGHLAAFPWLRFLGDTLKLAFPCILMWQGMRHLIISHLNPLAEFLKVVLFLPTIIKKLPSIQSITKLNQEAHLSSKFEILIYLLSSVVE